MARSDGDRPIPDRVTGLFSERSALEALFRVPFKLQAQLRRTGNASTSQPQVTNERTVRKVALPCQIPPEGGAGLI